jgi:hypothetical protein
VYINRLSQHHCRVFGLFTLSHQIQYIIPEDENSVFLNAMQYNLFGVMMEIVQKHVSDVVHITPMSRNLNGNFSHVMYQR